MKRYLEGRLQAARESGGDGLIAELVRVEKEGGRRPCCGDFLVNHWLIIP